MVKRTPSPLVPTKPRELTMLFLGVNKETKLDVIVVLSVEKKTLELTVVFDNIVERAKIEFESGAVFENRFDILNIRPAEVLLFCNVVYE